MKAIIEHSNYTRTVELNIKNESLIDTYRYKNGEVRTTTLVGSFDKLGSYHSL